MQINDQIDIKNNNAKSILNELRFNNMLTKKSIADRTNLSFATVSNLSNELKAMNILVESKVNEKRIGRIPDALSLNYDKLHIIALDVQLESMLGFAIVNIRNEIVHKQLFDISHLVTAQAVVAFALEIFSEYLAAHPSDDAIFIGIGASVPAVFDSKSGTLVLSSLPIYENAPLKQLLIDAFKMPAYVDNLTNIGALSVYTRYPSCKNIISLDVSQGVGVGIISEGSLIRGKNGYATEIAHVPIGDTMKRCPTCGGYGCIETELSLAGMIQLFPEIEKSLPLIKRWETFIQKMNDCNDKTDFAAKYIGSLIGRLSTILINLFDPDIFFITGYITDIFKWLEPHFYRELELRCRLSMNRNLEIVIDQNSKHYNIYMGLCDALYNMWNPLL
jgi:predicted NBD/HSP70 family sugar kinase